MPERREPFAAEFCASRAKLRESASSEAAWTATQNRPGATRGRFPQRGVEGEGEEEDHDAAERDDLRPA